MQAQCTTGTLSLSGKLGLKAIRKPNKRWEILKWKVKNFFAYRWREIPTEIALGLNWLLRKTICPGLSMPWHGRMYMKVVKANGEVWDYGFIGVHTITTTGKGFVVDAWQNSVELESMKYHGLGTGTTASAAGDTAIETELSTAYNPNSTRATGSTTEASATVFRSVGTNTLDGAAAVTEWGLLSQAATGGGVLFDRQVFSAVNLASGDGLQTTYDLTVG